MRDEPERCQRVLDIAEYMRKGYKSLGFDIGKSETPVVPIIIGDDELTFKFWKMLFDNGVFVNPVVSPAVSQGHQLLRTSYMATHTDAQMDEVLSVFARVGKEIGII
ncbi:MAG: aminotransferase class I/II-fold pyridoxal phosphate-dependent enzyme [Anaerolineaceae bacterium]|nr:aminotransferase class I/II-fold pyridoxal phosphate-dependent enzyme [Anaerolineaceae bacterium]